MLTPGEAGTGGGKIGELVVFRTKGFSDITPVTLAAEASLNAAGSYAVRDKL